MNKSLLVFGVGLIVGAGSMHLFDIHRKGRSDDKGSGGQSQGNDGQTFDSSWSELDRKRISEFLQNDEYTESDESNDDVRSEDTAVETGNVVIVDEELNHVGTVGDIEHPTSSFIDISDPLEDLISEKSIELDSSKLISGDPVVIDAGEITTGSINIDTIRVAPVAPESDDQRKIVPISAVEFVKAVTNGNKMLSFVYNRMSEELWWNFTDVPLSHDEIEKYLTTSLWDAISLELTDESTSNPLPLYFYDKTHDVYIKIE